MIVYSEDVRGLSAEQLRGFFVGWPNPPTAEVHLKILQGSYAVVVAREEGSNDLVGFINAVSEGVLMAYIPLLEVRPDFQGQGIGAELTRRMLARLSHLYGIDLLCDDDVRPFYERLGMRPAGGMMIRNYGNQSGAGGE